MPCITHRAFYTLLSDVHAFRPDEPYTLLRIAHYARQTLMRMHSAAMHAWPALMDMHSALMNPDDPNSARRALRPGPSALRVA